MLACQVVPIFFLAARVQEILEARVAGKDFALTLDATGWAVGQNRCHHHVWNVLTSVPIEWDLLRRVSWKVDVLDGTPTVPTSCEQERLVPGIRVVYVTRDKRIQDFKRCASTIRCGTFSTTPVFAWNLSSSGLQSRASTRVILSSSPQRIVSV